MIKTETNPTSANSCRPAKRFRFLLPALLFVLLLPACAGDNEDEPAPPPEISGIENEYSVLEGDELKLSPVVANGNQARYTWLLDGSKVGETLEYTLRATVPGNYKLVFKVETAGGSDAKETTVTVIALGDPPAITRIESEYEVTTEAELKLSPDVVSDTEVTFSWMLNGEEVGDKREYTFSASQPGKYILVLKATNRGGTTEKTVTVTVNPPPRTLQVQVDALLELETPGYVDGETPVKWEMTQRASELCRLSHAGSRTALFAAAKEGEYKLTMTAGDIKNEVTIVVGKRDKQPSAYISNVFDYLPAPGQFVNELPKYTAGDTHADMVRKAGEWLVGEDAAMITLGGWGGYVTAGFDHTIVNVPGRRDFRIYGNAFGAALGRPDAPFGGSCEPGVIMVAYDKNKNGKPDDDEWYEIKGSSNFSATQEPWYGFAVENGNDVNVYRDYEMTYHKPETETPDQDGEPDNPLNFERIKNYIQWQDNKGNSGYKVKNVYHSQTYYPSWLNEDKLTFAGIRLPENGINEGQFVPGINEGNVYFVLYGFRYGYVDNRPNVADDSAIDIDWAIDKDGKKADLPGIDFVKVYNGVNQENGWLGECSTEVGRGEDLHVLGKNIATINE